MIEHDEELDKYINKAFFAGVTRLIMLREIKRGNNYPYGILKELKSSHNVHIRKITKNEVYNILNALERDGFVESASKLEGGKVQKRYVLTHKGMRLVRKAGRVMVRHLKAVKRIMAGLNG